MAKKKNIDKLPEGWEWKEIGTIAKTTSGGTPNRSKTEYWNGKIPWLKSGELTDGLVIKNSEFITKLGLDKSSAKIVNKGTLMLAMYGATAGKLGILGIDTATNQAICAIRNDYSLFEEMYMFYYLLSQRTKIIKDSFGGAQPNISQSYIRSLQIPLPPLQEQKRLVKKLDGLFEGIDKAIELVKQNLEEIPQLKKSLLDQAFKGQLFGAATVGDNGLPLGWEWKKLKEVCLIKRGKSKHRPRNEPSLYGGKYPLIQTGNIRSAGGGYITTFDKTYNEKGLAQSKLWVKGTLCITIAANIGETAILGIDACFPDSVVGLICQEGYLSNLYTNYFFRYFKSELDKLSTKTAQKNINVSILEKIQIPLPPLPEQQKIVKKLDELFQNIDQLEAANKSKLEHWEQLKKSLLDQAFKGKL
jgi:type I restriction enzyme S subunit